MAETDEERRIRRRARIEEMKREKKRTEMIQRTVYLGSMVLFALAIFAVGNLIHGRIKSAGESVEAINTTSPAQTYVQQMKLENLQAAGQGFRGDSEAVGDGMVGTSGEGNGASASGDSPAVVSGEGTMMAVSAEPTSSQRQVFTAVETDAVVGFQDTILSEYGVVIDVERGMILAEKAPRTRMSPASMTKILTLLTAAEALGLSGEDWQNAPVLNEKFTITRDITDYCFVNDCSNVGFEVGEEVTVRDLFYGTILPSGADAALGLACYVAGSQEAFVEMMNRKLAELDMSDTTHFTNCVGLYDENHYSTVYDIAVILETTAKVPFCRDVLSAHTYSTTPTKEHPEGMVLSNWFLRRIEDKETGGEVLCGKTGYVLESKSCAASLALDGSGREYICVTAGSQSSQTCINDHAELYRTWIH